MKDQPNKLLNFVLQQDDHLKNIQKIITRDFFPALGQLQQADSAPNLTLNTYLANFKSDENQNFTKIVQDDAKLWKEKNWWIEHSLNKEEVKQKMLEAGSDRPYSNMLQGDNRNTLAITPAEPDNALFFNRDTQYVDLAMEKYDKQKKVVFENTRLEESDKPLEYAASQVRRQIDPDYILDTKLPSTPLLQGIEDEQLKKRQKYSLDTDGFRKPPIKKRILETVNGYKMVPIPSPSPQSMQSPLMTYGQIEDTPQRLPEYKIPNTPQRDLLLQKLNQNITNKKRQQRNKKEATVMRIFGSSTPGALKSSSKPKQTSSYRKPSSVRREESSKDLEGLLKL